jgi:phage-related protein
LEHLILRELAYKSFSHIDPNSRAFNIFLGRAVLMLANMSNMTYYASMSQSDKPLVWLHGEVKSPPFSPEARMEAGYLLRSLQHGLNIGMPHSRPMPSIGRRCHELRIADNDGIWRILYRIDDDAILVLEVFSKKTAKTPKPMIDVCKQRARRYDDEAS